MRSNTHKTTKHKSSKSSHQDKNNSVDVDAKATFDQLLNLVTDDPTNFDGWIHLLHCVERLDDLKKCREIYDDFLAKFPFCYGYWKKYAELELKNGSTKKCFEVFQRGVQSVPLSIDLWLDFINFVKSDSSKDYYVNLDSYLEQALNAAGLDFRSDKLWEAAIEHHTERGNLRSALEVFDRLIHIPTHLYSIHFERLQEFVNRYLPDQILTEKEYYELFGDIEEVLKQKGIELYVFEECSDIAPSPSRCDSPSAVCGSEQGSEPDTSTTTEPKNVPQYNKKFSDEALQLFRLKIIDRRRKVHLNTEQEVSKRWMFEQGIKRPYFHAKPLERCQLKNWRQYLEFEIGQGSRKRIEILFERAVVACCLYEDMWIKYARFMESFDEVGARAVFQRACYTHLPRKPNPRLAWAAFEERKGYFDNARRVLAEFSQARPGHLCVEMRRLNLERRRLQLDARRVPGNYGTAVQNGHVLDGASDTEAASSSSGTDYTELMRLYDDLIRTKESQPSIASFYAVKYARFADKTKNDPQLAEKILLDAIDRDSTNPRLYLQLIDMAFHRRPMAEQDVLTSFDRALKSHMSLHEKLGFSQRKLEFLEDLGSDISSLQEHYEWHQKLWKGVQNAGGSPSKRHASANDQSTMAKHTRMSSEDQGQSIGSSAASVATTPRVSTDPSLQPTTGASSYYDYYSQTYPHQWNQYGAYYYPPPY